MVDGVMFNNICIAVLMKIVRIQINKNIHKYAYLRYILPFLFCNNNK